MNEEDLMTRGDAMARRCAMDGVLENQLAMVLAHLNRHRNPQATRELVRAMPRSVFATRSGRARGQYEALERHVSPELGRVKTWEEAAVVVGWAKRLWSSYKRR